MTELKEIVARNSATLLQDFLGASALVSAFVVVLLLPVFI